MSPGPQGLDRSPFREPPPDVAARTGGLALTPGRAAGDNDAQAHAYRTLGQIGVGQGHHDRAVLYARRGLGDDERALLHVLLGRALALIPGKDPAMPRTAETAPPDSGSAFLILSRGTGPTSLARSCCDTRRTACRRTPRRRRTAGRYGDRTR